MTTRRLASSAAALLAVGLLVTLTGCLSSGYLAAHASHGHRPTWVHGPGFWLGPSSFIIVHASDRTSPGYFFRTRYLGPSRYCGPYCFSRRGHHYHHAGCRHLRGYVARHGYHVGELIDRYGPRRYR